MCWWGVGGGGVACVMGCNGGSCLFIAMRGGVVVAGCCLLSRHGDMRGGIDIGVCCRVLWDMSEQADTVNKGHKMNKYTSASAITKATQAESAIGGLWAQAYESAHADMQQEGANLRDMAQAITKAGVKCSKDTAGDYIMAHELTTHGDVFTAALASRIGEGKVMRAHSLIAKARKARGVSYVRAVLASIAGDDDAQLTKAMTKAVRDLDAARREETDKGDKAQGVEGVEVVEVEEVTGQDDPATKATATDILRGLMPLTIALRDAVTSGDVPPSLDAWLMEVGAIAREVKAIRAA